MIAPQYRLGVDVGGTFTDFVLVEERSGTLIREKCLTTPDDPIAGILNGIERLRASGAVQPQHIHGVAHATTLVTNTLIERKGAATALLTSDGFRDVLELGSDMRYDMYDLAIEFPEPLVERSRRVGIPERVGADGVSLVRPDLSAVRNLVAALVQDGVKSIAVCFLHSYRNASHEREVLEVIRSEFPQVDVSISSTVAPEIREYERTVTVVANAYVKPIARSYLNRLESALADSAVKAPILVMLSNGGMTTPRTAAEVPIRLIESGPAAGVLSACYAGARIGENDVLAFDMGGTTAKACFVDGGKPAFTGMFEAARVRRQFRGSGMPLKVPSVEMIEIGAGGGSIARIDGTGLLKVGPDSAGAKPGPVCYGLGGTGPTVTDADLVLGYLDPDYFLGGDMALDMDGAKRQVERLGRQGGLSMTETAAGIAQVVNQNMATAIRIHAAERGKDYRNYVLFAFGGAGPVHAYEIARILGLRKIVCPIGAGTNSAFGLLAAPVAIDLSRSYNVALAEIEWARLNALFQEMEAEARTVLLDARVKKPSFVRTAEMRFVGQGFEIAVAVSLGKLGPGSIKAIKASFHEAYRKIYDSLPGDLPIEALTWRLRASGPAPDVVVTGRGAGDRARPRQRRRVYFPEIKKYVDTGVISRYALKPGERFSGPAIIEERESTVVVGPGGQVKVDSDFNLVIEMRRK
ncbi:MAG: methylhydantoinase [Betaproteobacteria bacterium]|nr:methylhydantoinase [Betaproteobacteria bacterium]